MVSAAGAVDEAELLALAERAFGHLAAETGVAEPEGGAFTGGLAPASNIEAVSTVRLYELWAERSFGEAGSIRFGQLAATT